MFEGEKTFKNLKEITNFSMNWTESLSERLLVSRKMVVNHDKYLINNEKLTFREQKIPDRQKT